MYESSWADEDPRAGEDLSAGEAFSVGERSGGNAGSWCEGGGDVRGYGIAPDAAGGSRGGAAALWNEGRSDGRLSQPRFAARPPESGRRNLPPRPPARPPEASQQSDSPAPPPHRLTSQYPYTSSTRLSDRSVYPQWPRGDPMGDMQPMRAQQSADSDCSAAPGQPAELGQSARPQQPTDPGPPIEAGPPTHPQQRMRPEHPAPADPVLTVSMPFPHPDRRLPLDFRCAPRSGAVPVSELYPADLRPMLTRHRLRRRRHRTAASMLTGAALAFAVSALRPWAAVMPAPTSARDPTVPSTQTRAPIMPSSMAIADSGAGPPR